MPWLLAEQNRGAKYAKFIEKKLFLTKELK